VRQRALRLAVAEHARELADALFPIRLDRRDAHDRAILRLIFRHDEVARRLRG